MAAIALAARLEQEYSAHAKKRSELVTKMAADLWKQAQAIPIAKWVVGERIVHPEGKFIFGTPPPSTIETTLTWTLEITESIRALIVTLRGPGAAADTKDTPETFTGEIFDGVKKALGLVINDKKGQFHVSVGRRDRYSSEKEPAAYLCAITFKKELIVLAQQ